MGAVQRFRGDRLFLPFHSCLWDTYAFMIDLRSDTVTRPTPAMRRAMLEAEVGDDVFGDDPTVQRLEELAAGRMGKEASLFAPSATQANLIALLTHCGRGDEAIVGQQAHNYLFEGGGGACLGGIQPQPLDQESDGTLSLERVQSLIKPDDYHYARTRLLCLENTTWGKVLPVGYAEEARKLAKEEGLSLHLDGSRLFNAAVALSRPAADLAEPFDSVTLCLSKGLGAPVGALLAGDSEFVKEGKRWRKMLGGGMRQSGLLAAAGIHALDNHVERLAEDHENARRLARGLKEIEGIHLEPVCTNMVFAGIPPGQMSNLVEFLKAREILVSGFSGEKLRLVTHLDVSAEDIDTAMGTFREFFA